MECIICRNKNLKRIYKGPVRSGSPGKFTKNQYSVLKCECSFVMLEKSFKINYENDSYRTNYNDTINIKDYQSTHDVEQNERISKIGIEKFRDKVVLDFGSGGGSFLDSVYGFAKKTIAIEPFKGYHNDLVKKGHQVYSNIDDFLKKNELVDIIISFGVIEHVEDPNLYLSKAYLALKKSGNMFIETDNLDDVLFKFKIKEFDSFYYRTVHNWYFNSETLNQICLNHNFKVGIGFRHGYGISNTFNWLKEREPKGNKKIDFINDEIDQYWKNYLEKNQLAELLHFKLTK